MAEIYRSDIVRVDLDHALLRKYVGAILATGDKLGNRFGAEIFRDGQPVDVTGCGVTAYFMRPGEDAIVLNGTASGSVAYVDLAQACYSKASSFTLTIKISYGGATTALRVIDGYILLTQTDDLVDPGDVVPTLDDLLAQIEAMEQATAEATTAADAANEAWEVIQEDMSEYVETAYSGADAGNAIFSSFAMPNSMRFCGNKSEISGRLDSVTANVGVGANNKTVTVYIYTQDGDVFRKTATFDMVLTKGVKTYKNGVDFMLDDEIPAGSIIGLYANINYQVLSYGVDGTKGYNITSVGAESFSATPNASYNHGIGMKISKKPVLEKVNALEVKLEETSAGLLKTQEDVEEIDAWQDETGKVSGKAISGYFDGKKNEYDNVLENHYFYNDGVVIKYSLDNNYNGVICDISALPDDTVIYMPPMSGDSNCRRYAASSTALGTEGNFCQTITPSSETEWAEGYGYRKYDGYDTWTLGELRQKKGQTKALFVGALKSDWFNPFYYSSDGTQKTLDWLAVQDGNLVDANTAMCWGDSMTRGAVASYGNGYPEQLKAMLGDGYTVLNMGVSGEDVYTIAGRQGGVPFVCGNTPFTIPTWETPVAIDIASLNGKAVKPFVGGDSFGINPVYISGVKGDISYSGGVYYFTRAGQGDAVAVNRPTIIETNAMRNYARKVGIFWIMGNDGADGASDLDVIADYIQQMVEAGRCERYLVLSKTSFVADYATDYADSYDAKMHRKFGQHYINVRKYLIDYGLDDLGISPTAEDAAAIAARVIPPSLKSDASVHLTTEGYGIVAKLVYLRGKALGYWQ